MYLSSIEFVDSEGDVQQWTLKGLTLGNKNLIVGKNSSGKSRAINIIWHLVRLLAGLETPRMTIKYDARFVHDKQHYHYKLTVVKGDVHEEILNINNKDFLKREVGGLGTIQAVEEGRPLKFQAPTNTLAVVSRRDSIQHGFLEPLYTWASTARYYPFSTYLGKDNYAIITPNGPSVDSRDSNAAIGLYREGCKKYSAAYTNSVIEDLAVIGYEIEELSIKPPISINFLGAPGDPVGLYVKEKDLPGITDQASMSVGMFRVLSLIIQLNYSRFEGTGSTVLVDDIGEGLDYDRSCRLINLLRSKADSQNIQLIMTTNDKFVMNEVPLDEWSVLLRTKNIVNVKNVTNSRETFEEFKFTGLSNFSFFELEVTQ